MKNMNYAKKFHYMLKYFILALPLLLIVLFYLGGLSSNISSQDYGFYKSFFDYSQNAFSWFVDLTNRIDFGFNHFYTELFNVIFSVYPKDFLLRGAHIAFVISMYPLWIISVYIFDLIVDVFCLLPKLAHRLMDKLSGGENY